LFDLGGDFMRKISWLIKILTLGYFILPIIIMITPAFSFADSYQPSHSCHKPIKPISFTSQWELDNFRWEVDRYKRCIEDFVEEQKEAIENHRNGLNEAVEEWNRFVRYNF
jgi:hypothetical protein